MCPCESTKLTLMSESLRNDGRIWVPAQAGDTRAPASIPEHERDYYLERRYPAYGNLTPRDIASRAASERIEAGHGVGPLGNAVYLDFADAVVRRGAPEIERRYGNLLAMYRKIMGSNPLEEPMRIAPAAHFSMGGLWVDYELMTTVPGLFALGECNFSDHGANRLGANSLLQACVDGYFIAPSTIGNFLAPLVGTPLPSVDDASFEVAEIAVRSRVERLMSIGGTEPVEAFHRRLGQALWKGCGIVRSARSLSTALEGVQSVADDFLRTVRIPGLARGPNSELEKALRLHDYLELGALMCRDALSRDESCGAHFRTEHQTEGGEALRNDRDYCFVSAWQHRAAGNPVLLREPLEFASVALTARSYG